MKVYYQSCKKRNILWTISGAKNKILMDYPPDCDSQKRTVAPTAVLQLVETKYGTLALCTLYILKWLLVNKT